jgi:hypothetical protein
MQTGRVFWALVAAAMALAGCGSSSKFGGASIHVFMQPSATPSNSNYFTIAMTDDAGHCPLSAGATLAINGKSYPFGSCTGASDLFEGNPSFALQATDGDNEAEMDVDGLVPGIDAMIASPADGHVALGGVVTFSIPTVFQGQVPENGYFENTNNVDTYAGTVTFPTSSEIEADELPVPEHAATYNLWVQMGASAVGGTFPGHVLSCEGFAHCYPEAIDELGPMQVTVTP